VLKRWNYSAKWKYKQFKFDQAKNGMIVLVQLNQETRQTHQKDNKDKTRKFTFQDWQTQFIHSFTGKKTWYQLRKHDKLVSKAQQNRNLWWCGAGRLWHFNRPFPSLVEINDARNIFIASSYFTIPLCSLFSLLVDIWEE
jgi:hypothetical protein